MAWFVVPQLVISWSRGTRQAKSLCRHSADDGLKGQPLDSVSALVICATRFARHKRLHQHADGHLTVPGPKQCRKRASKGRKRSVPGKHEIGWLWTRIFSSWSRTACPDCTRSRTLTRADPGGSQGNRDGALGKRCLNPRQLGALEEGAGASLSSAARQFGMRWAGAFWGSASQLQMERDLLDVSVPYGMGR